MVVNNKVQLITYPDSLGGNLKALKHVLDQYFCDAFGGIHILPPFPSSGDRGFAPLSYFEIDNQFGSWDDIRSIGNDYDVMIDLMVNHISSQSSYFQDFLQKGLSSQYADMFITLDKIWEDGQPRQENIRKMSLRRKVPYSIFNTGETGDRTCVWTTFGKTDPSEQIDLDIHSNNVKKLYKDIFQGFARQGIKMVRLDAVGYVVKKAGTSCFFVEPEICDLLGDMKQMGDEVGIEILPEIHSNYHIQYKLAESGYWIYDFILPYMILDALLTRSGERLAQYLKTRPPNQFTMLDCHDGIPVKPDLDDLVDPEQARKIVDICVERGANLSRIVSNKDKGEEGFDVHQIRCTYYSALNHDAQAYLSARALQFFTPGIPQVYYVGLLAGENDLEAVHRSREGREINRHNFTVSEIKESMGKTVVKDLLWLIRFRNEHPAFRGVFRVVEPSNSDMRLIWENGEQKCCLTINFVSGKSIIAYTDDNGMLCEHSIQ